MTFFKHPSAIVSDQAVIGDKTRIWAFTNIQQGVVIGEGCNICDHCFIEKGVVVGNHVTIKNAVALFDGIILEDDVFCGANTAFINDRYPRSHRKDPWTLERILVKKGATLGSNSTILCGVTIGYYAFIGAASVVTQDIADYALVAGNPARQIGWACQCGQKLPQDLCCACGLKYQHQGQHIVLNV